MLLNYILIQSGSQFKTPRPFTQKECPALAALFSSRKPGIIDSPAWSAIARGRPLAEWLERHTCPPPEEVARSDIKIHADSSPGPGSFPNFFLCLHWVRNFCALFLFYEEYKSHHRLSWPTSPQIPAYSDVTQSSVCVWFMRRWSQKLRVRNSSPTS